MTSPLLNIKQKNVEQPDIKQDDFITGFTCVQLFGFPTSGNADFI